jgi:hypothetical protein
MNTKLWVYLYQQMHMIGHDLHTQYLCLMLLAYLAQDGCHLLGYSIHKNLPAIFGTPHHMIRAGVVHVSIGLVGDLCMHTIVVQHRSTYCQASTPHRSQ